MKPGSVFDGPGIAMKSQLNPYLATLLLALTAKAAAGERLTDPTRPAPPASARAAVPNNGFRVEAVLHSEQRDLAIVNGQVVRVGDLVGSARVAEILPHGVRYVRNGHTHLALVRSSSLQVRQAPSRGQDSRGQDSP